MSNWEKILEHFHKGEILKTQSLLDDLFLLFLQNKDTLQAQKILTKLPQDSFFSFYRLFFEIFISLETRNYSELKERFSEIRSKYFRKDFEKTYEKLTVLVESYREETDILDIEELILNLYAFFKINKPFLLDKNELRNLMIYSWEDQTILEYISVLLYEQGQLILSNDIYDYVLTYFSKIKTFELSQLAKQERWNLSQKYIRLIKANQRAEDKTTLFQSALSGVRIQALPQTGFDLQKFALAPQKEQALENISQDLELKEILARNVFETKEDLILFLTLSGRFKEVIDQVEEYDSWPIQYFKANALFELGEFEHCLNFLEGIEGEDMLSEAQGSFYSLKERVRRELRK